MPEKGEANTELLRYLTSIFNVGKSKIKLIQGDTSRHKQIEVIGLSLEQIQAKLEPYLAKRQENQIKKNLKKNQYS